MRIDDNFPYIPLEVRSRLDARRYTTSALGEGRR
jgi:hypothetical protein